MGSSNIAVLGDGDSVLCFRALGIPAFPVANSEEAGPILKRLCAENYALIFLTEPVAREILGLIDDLSGKPLPSIVLIPDSRGSLGLAMKKLKRTAVRALGQDIIAEGQET